MSSVFIPRVPLSLAEQHVDFTAHNNHIVQQRLTLEQAAAPAARRIAVLAAQMHGLAPVAAIDGLAAALGRGLAQTAAFGADSAVAELAALRGSRPVTAEWQFSDAGRYGSVAADGLQGVLRFVGRRASETARAVAAAAAEAVHDAQTITVDAGAIALAAALDATRRSLHNHVLELVGETLNLGRTAGALSLSSVPEFALRSEQLDANTCAPCDGLHGTIVVVGSPEYFAVLPPTGCLGGGRCRGIYVFGDGPRDVRQPELLAA